MARIILRRNQARFWSAHTHSKFSFNDALPTVKDLVAEAKRLGYRGLGLTDHGNMAGSIQLYSECMKAGIKPFPGSEFYVVHNREDKKAKRHHLGMLAFSTQGYRNLVRISTLSHRNFYNKPLLDLVDLASLKEEGLTEGIALMTGCYFGFPIQKLVQEGYDAAKQMVSYYRDLFPETYVELQNHCIDHGDGHNDESVSKAMFSIAQDLDLPVLLTQDSHYARAEDKPYHEALKKLIAYGPDPDEAVFPGDGFHLADDAWMEAHHDPTLLNAGYAGLDRLLDLHSLRIAELDTYSYRVPVFVSDPLRELRVRCSKTLAAKGLLKPRYLQRLADELDTVEASRMAGYLLLVAEVADWMRAQHIFYQCRGSAAGSLLCYLLGITNVDPLRWELRFDRFLSKDRMKPPDIDLDVEHDRRHELIEWLSSRFAVCQIGTWLTYSLAGDEEGKGSLRVRYLSRMRKTTGEADWKAIGESERKELDDLSQMKLYSGYGVHAAGLVVTNTRDELESLVPLMYVASSKTFVSQYDMGDVEKIGLVKLDALGLKTMSVLRQTLVKLGKDPAEGLDWIPLNDRSTFSMISRGDTDGVFQLEGGTASRGVRRLRPSHIRDVIAAMALFRPATMVSGATDSYIDRKHSREHSPDRHGIIAAATKSTYGILLYQEQVISVLRDLGMDADNLTAFLKAVKASNANVGNAAAVIDGYKEQILTWCHDAGMNEADVEWLWDAIEAFAGYGFNKAHATVYGLAAYRCAYLASHHPVQFHAALLAVAAGTPKESKYISATRSRGIRLLRPDVNLSKATYDVDPKGKGIRKGLLAVKGIGIKVAEEIQSHQPYASLSDFAERVNPRIISGVKDFMQTGSRDVGKMAVLTEHECFDSIKEA